MSEVGLEAPKKFQMKSLVKIFSIKTKLIVATFTLNSISQSKNFPLASLYIVVNDNDHAFMFIQFRSHL